MLEPKSITIGETSYIIQPWPAMKAWRMQTTLGRTFKTCLSKLGAAIQDSQSGKGLDSDVDLEKLGEAFAELFESLNETEAERIILLLLSGVHVNGQTITKELFDVHFIGKIVDVYKLIYHVLEVNYSSFLAGSSIGKLLNRAQS